MYCLSRLGLARFSCGMNLMKTDRLFGVFSKEVHACGIYFQYGCLKWLILAHNMSIV